MTWNPQRLHSQVPSIARHIASAIPSLVRSGPAISSARTKVSRPLNITKLKVAPEIITFSILAAVYRAALGGVDFGLHIAGPTGAGKTELAALAQQHYGAGMNRLHLPAA
jgi:hypothetical protein